MASAYVNMRSVLLNPVLPVLVGVAGAVLMVVLVTRWLDWDNLTYGPHYWAQVQIYGWPVDVGYHRTWPSLVVTLVLVAVMLRVQWKISSPSRRISQV